MRMLFIIKTIGDSLLSSWIWQFTADWFHPILAGICMFFLMRVVMRTSRMRALLISAASQIVALGLLSIFAIGILVHLLGWEFALLDPYEGVQQIAFFWPCVVLGMWYALFQSACFLLASLVWRVQLLGLLIVCWLSNGIGAMLSYLFVRIAEIMKYTG